MPTYQYSCTECGHFLEKVQSFSEDSLTVCPECEGRLRKVFNAVGVVFKGSGFYRTDSRTAAAAGSSTPGPSSGAGTPAAAGAPAASSSTSGSTGGSSTPSAGGSGSKGSKGESAA